MTTVTPPCAWWPPSSWLRSMRRRVATRRREAAEYQRAQRDADAAFNQLHAALDNAERDIRSGLGGHP